MKREFEKSSIENFPTVIYQGNILIDYYLKNKNNLFFSILSFSLLLFVRIEALIFLAILAAILVFKYRKNSKKLICKVPT